jgi:hypothetical protein
LVSPGAVLGLDAGPVLEELLGSPAALGGEGDEIVERGMAEAAEFAGQFPADLQAVA